MSYDTRYSKEIMEAADRLDILGDNFELYQSFDDDAKKEFDSEMESLLEIMKTAWDSRDDVLIGLVAKGIDPNDFSVHSYFPALGAQHRNDLNFRVVTHPKSAIRSALGVFPTAAQTLEWFEARTRN